VLAAAAVQPDFDVVIIGAGAAGIAGARRVAAASRKCVALEASERWGGHWFTDVQTFRVPYERGARSIYTPDLNPLGKPAAKAGFDDKLIELCAQADPVLIIFAAACQPLGSSLRVGRHSM
jgi:cation diffusion facilitator CzcD-associated flavoprotein CzcO